MGSRRRLSNLLLANGLLLPGMLAVPLGGVELAGARVDCARVPVEAAPTSTRPPHRCAPPSPRRRDDDDDRRTANLGISGHNGLSVARPGQRVTYTLRVRNTGPDGVRSAVVWDKPPATLERVHWTCTVIRGGGCDHRAGVGRLRTTVDLRAGGAITFTLTGLVRQQAALGRRQLYNVAAVLVPRHVHDPHLSNNLAVDIDDLAAAPVAAPTTLAPPPSVTSPPATAAPPTTAPPAPRPAPTPPPPTAAPTTVPAPASPPMTALRDLAPQRPKHKPHHGLLVVAGVTGMLLMTVVATARPTLPSARRQKS